MALSRSSFAANERTLRILTLYTSALATPLLIACTAVSFEVGARYWYMYRGVNAFCFGYIPLALTGFASALSLLRRKKTDTQLPAVQLVFLDGLAGISYLGILIGIWAVEIRMLGKSGFGLLAGYTTAPMIVNMFVHGYIVACNISTFIKWLTTPKLHQCPNCHSNFAVRNTTQVQVTTQSGEGYSLLRGEDYLDVDADAEPYAGETARSSEEQIRPEAQSKSEDKKVLVV